MLSLHLYAICRNISSKIDCTVVGQRSMQYYFNLKEFFTRVSHCRHRATETPRERESEANISHWNN